jgi:hypothetical protein
MVKSNPKTLALTVRDGRVYLWCRFGWAELRYEFTPRQARALARKLEKAAERAGKGRK